MESRSQEYNNWNKLVEKTVATEAKASLQPFYYNRNMDNCCPKGNCPNYIMMSKSLSNCDDYLEKTQTS